MTGFPVGEEGAHGPLRLVLSTFPDEESAREASRRVVRDRLAACASRWRVQSAYLWKGRLQDTQEVAVLFKTSPKKVGALFEALRKGHPYEVPEILEVDLPQVHAPYLRWALAAMDPDPRSALLAASVPPSASERPPGGRQASGRTRRPGRSRPSRNSRAAPPPVLT